YLPPEGDNSVPRPVSKDNAERQRNAYFVNQTHALLLEDSVSYFQRHQQAWTVQGTEKNEKSGRQFLVLKSTGKTAPGPVHGEQKFDFDDSTRVWKGKEFASLSDIRPGQTVQVNLAWDPGWGYGKFHVSDIWLDQT